MPRPQRSKAALTASTSRAQRVPPASPTVAARKNEARKPKDLTEDDMEEAISLRSKGRAQPAEKEPRGEGLTDRAQNSPDVTNARQRRGRAAVKKTVETEEQVRALENLRRRRDEALGKKSKDVELEVVPSTIPQEEEPHEEEPREAEKVVTVVSRSTANALERRQKAVSPPKEISPPESAIRVRKTPAIDSSVLALANFKRRPRQPSILRMVQQSVDRNATSSASEGISEDLDDELEPDDESTPLNVRVSTEQQDEDSEPDAEGTSPQRQALRTSSARKRKFDEVEESDVQVPRSSPPAPEIGNQRETSALAGEQGTAFDDELPEDVTIEATQHPEQGGAEEPELPPEQEEEIYSETMAPPRSSSSPSLPSRPPQAILPQPQKRRNTTAQRAQSALPKRRTRPRKRKSKASEAENATDEGLSPSSEDDEATKVNPGNTTFKGGNGTSFPGLSTAHLQSMLPQRRRRPPRGQHDAFDIPSSSERDHGDIDVEINPEDDELQHPVSRHRRRSAAAASKSKKKATPLKKPTKKNTSKSAPAATAPPSSTTKRQTHARKTYTDRRGPSSSDKENHDDSSSSDNEEREAPSNLTGNGESEDEDTTLVEPSAELKKVVDKFKEVDAWEMEFESVQVEGGRSSSFEWR